MDNFRKYFVEFLGTFFLMFTIGMIATLPGNGVITAVAIGLVLMVLVYAGGFISGGHYNPAVSLAAALRGALPMGHLIQYMIAQILGGAAGAGLVAVITDLPEITMCSYSVMQILLGEFVFTFLLCFVVLAVATARETEGNSYFGLAIGAALTVGAFVAGGVICYGAFNPAVALGLWMLRLSCMWLTIITIIGNLLAAVVAAYTFKYLIRASYYE